MINGLNNDGSNELLCAKEVITFQKNCFTPF